MGINIYKFTNFGQSTLASGITDTATTLTVQTDDGALFPTLAVGERFQLVLGDANGNREIVACTARSTDTLTIARAQEGTSAQAWDSGDFVSLRNTAAVMEAIKDDFVTWGTEINTHDHDGGTLGAVTLGDGSSGTTQPITDDSSLLATTEFVQAVLDGAGGGGGGSNVQVYHTNITTPLNIGQGQWWMFGELTVPVTSATARVLLLYQGRSGNVILNHVRTRFTRLVNAVDVAITDGNHGTVVTTEEGQYQANKPINLLGVNMPGIGTHVFRVQHQSGIINTTARIESGLFVAVLVE